MTFHEEVSFKRSKELQCDSDMRSLDKPLAERRSAWCRDSLQEAEKHGAPSGTSREQRRLEIYSMHVS